MTKAEWGTKRTCTTCGARFYDMLKDPIICPKCGAENEKEVAPKKRGKSPMPKEPTRKAAVIENDDDDTETTDDDDDDETTRDLIEDASDLGEDDDDMAEVIEHIEPGDKED